jgi:hypothetical protein
MQRIRPVILLLIAGCLLAGCSAPQAARHAQEGTSAQIKKAEPPPWQFFVTITPEQLQAARSAPECRPADNDSEGHWGALWEGIQLSIRLRKTVFTNGEPVLACVTLRNTGDKVRYFWVSTPDPERDTEVFLLRGLEHVPPADGPKPGQSFQERLKYIRAGSFHQEPLMPGTQRQFLRKLSEMFDLTLPGAYSAYAARDVVALEKVPNRPGYLSGSGTNLVSGTLTFQVVPSGHSR